MLVFILALAITLLLLPFAAAFIEWYDDLVRKFLDK